MKKTSILCATAALATAVCISPNVHAAGEWAEKVDKSRQARILITTDLECDDMNGIILSLMYADQYDLAGIVWTAGMYHFQGDGGLHTLGEITPNYRCNAQHCEHRVKTAADLTEYRPVDPTWLPRILDCYEADYALMSGSGSAVFGIFLNRDGAESACREFGQAKPDNGGLWLV